ncbi:hypothetical protein ES703_22425 [subsurface metagenome]
MKRLVSLLTAGIIGASAFFFPLKARSEESELKLTHSDISIIANEPFPDARFSLRFSADKIGKPSDELILSGGREHTEESSQLEVDLGYNFNPNERFQPSIFGGLYIHNTPLNTYSLIKAGYENVLDFDWFKNSTCFKLGLLLMEEKDKIIGDDHIQILSGLEEKLELSYRNDFLSLGTDFCFDVVASYFQKSFDYDNLTLSGNVFGSIQPFSLLEFHSNYGVEWHKRNPDFYFFDSDEFSQNFLFSAKINFDEYFNLVLLYENESIQNQDAKDCYDTIGTKLYLNKWFSHFFHTMTRKSDESETSFSVGRVDSDKYSMEAFYTRTKQSIDEKHELVGFRVTFPFDDSSVMKNTASNYRLNPLLKDEYFKFHDFDLELEHFLRGLSLEELVDWWGANANYILELGQTSQEAYEQRGADCDGQAGALAGFITYLNLPCDAYVVGYHIIDDNSPGHGVLMIDDRKGKLIGYEYGKKFRIRTSAPTLEEKTELFLTKLMKYFALMPADRAEIYYRVHKGNPNLNKRYWDNPIIADGTFYYQSEKSSKFKPMQRGIEALIGRGRF